MKELNTRQKFRWAAALNGCRASHITLSFGTKKEPEQISVHATCAGKTAGFTIHRGYSHLRLQKGQLGTSLEAREGISDGQTLAEWEKPHVLSDSSIVLGEVHVGRSAVIHRDDDCPSVDRICEIQPPEFNGVGFLLLESATEPTKAFASDEFRYIATIPLGEQPGRGALFLMEYSIRLREKPSPDRPSASLPDVWPKGLARDARVLPKSGSGYHVEWWCDMGQGHPFLQVGTGTDPVRVLPDPNPEG